MSDLTICVPKTWEFVHSTVCKFFADNEIKYVYSKLGLEPYAMYSVNDEAIFTIMVYREAVLYDNEYDIILYFNGGGGDRALMAQWYKYLKDALLEIAPSDNIACPPGECRFDDLM